MLPTFVEKLPDNLMRPSHRPMVTTEFGVVNWSGNGPEWNGSSHGMKKLPGIVMASSLAGDWPSLSAGANWCCLGFGTVGDMHAT